MLSWLPGEFDSIGDLGAISRRPGSRRSLQAGECDNNGRAMRGLGLIGLALVGHAVSSRPNDQAPQ
jgi:hypothetical protein